MTGENHKYLIEIEISHEKFGSRTRKITVDVKEEMTNELLDGFCKQTEREMEIMLGIKCNVKAKGFWELK